MRGHGADRVKCKRYSGERMSFVTQRDLHTRHKFCSTEWRDGAA